MQDFQNLQALKPLCFALHTKLLQAQSFKTLVSSNALAAFEIKNLKTLAPYDVFKAFAIAFP